MSTCSLTDCPEERRKRGYCQLHYDRERHAGRLAPITDLERFRTFLDVGDCWEWRGTRTTDGYGRFRAGRLHLAHRWIWEALVGPIPHGFEVDHLCRNTGCVNPDHLDPVTPIVNWQRGQTVGARNARSNPK